MGYKFKYIIFKEKPYNQGCTVAQIDVSGKKRKAIKEIWDELEKEYPSITYASSLTETNQEYATFKTNPKPI